MPNYVLNEITVTGDREALEKFMQKVKGESSPFSFNSIIPMPASMNIVSGSDEERAILLILKGGLAYTSLIPKQYRESVIKAAASRKQSLCDMHVSDYYNGDYGLETYVSNDDPANADIARLLDGHIPITKADFIALGAIAIDNYVRYGAKDWYDWNCANWGCKWDAGDADVNLHENELFISFSTAWAMPEPVFIKMVEMFPNLHFEGRWADEDIGSNCGTWTGSGGRFETAQKIGRNWVIDDAEPWPDSRVKSGKYRDWRKPKGEKENDL